LQNFLREGETLTERWDIPTFFGPAKEQKKEEGAERHSDCECPGCVEEKVHEAQGEAMADKLMIEATNAHADYTDAERFQMTLMSNTILTRLVYTKLKSLEAINELGSIMAMAAVFMAEGEEDEQTE